MITRIKCLPTLILSAAVIALLPFVAVAQVPADLATKKDFSSGRASSTDPNLRNGDARRIDLGRIDSGHIDLGHIQGRIHHVGRAVDDVGIGDAFRLLAFEARDGLLDQAHVATIE